jgi:hypothetical protein
VVDILDGIKFQADEALITTCESGFPSGTLRLVLCSPYCSLCLGLGFLRSILYLLGILVVVVVSASGKECGGSSIKYCV